VFIMALGDAVKAIIKESGVDVLVCRLDRHAYDRRLSDVEMEGVVYAWTRVCGTCGTKRVQRLRANGYIISNTYLYPKGYQVEGGPLDKDDLANIRLYVMQHRMA
jgi:hypothetical protein